MNIEVIKVAITQKTTQQLIELRDEGMSYDKLAKVSNVATFQSDNHFTDLVSLINSIKFN